MVDTFELDLSYLKVLKKSVACEKCLEIPKDLRKITTCGHTICLKCLDNYSKLYTTCPKCKWMFGERDIEKPDEFTKTVRELVESLNPLLAETDYKIRNIPKKLFEPVSQMTSARDSSWNDYGIIHEISSKPIKKCVLDSGKSSLHSLCATGQLFPLMMLIEKGVDINSLDHKHQTALHVAVNSELLKCVRLLLSEGALIEVYDTDYFTPLHLAVRNGNEEIIKTLLQYGADKNAMNYYGCTPKKLAETNIIKKILASTKPMEYLPKQYLYYKKGEFIFQYRLEKRLNLSEYGFKIAEYPNQPDVFLCVLGNSVKMSDVTVLNCVAEGIMIVKEKDVHKFLQSNLPYMPELIPEEIRPGLLRSIQNKLEKKPRLFDGMHFYIINHKDPINIFGSLYNKKHLKRLIEYFDGAHFNSIPKVDVLKGLNFHPYHNQKRIELKQCWTFLIYEKGDPPLSIYDLKEMKHATSEWLVKCAMMCEICEVY